MTKCIRNKVNLKSSTYNQTGQSCFVQLETCKLMNKHLQKLLQAKSVIDAKNKDYILKKNREKALRDECERTGRSLRLEGIDDLIDKLAYDTKHHPMDVLKMDLSSNRDDCCDNIDFCQRSSRQRSSSRSSRQRLSSSRSRRRSSSRNSQQRLPSKSRQRSSSRSRRMSPATARLSKRTKCTTKPSCKCINDIDWSTKASRKKHMYKKDSLPYVTTSSTRSDSRPLIQETYDRCSIKSNSSLCCDDSVYDGRFFESSVPKLCCQEEEDKKYIKFVYDITKDIMKNGFYTDKELQDVFKKHIDQNRKKLNMNRMLYEIYQLKTSFNIADDSQEDEDEDLEEMIQMQKLLSASVIRPPTPPKVLDENKVMEKLECYQKMTDLDRRPSNDTKKSVTLVDTNHKLFITEEDVLLSLMESGVDPKQAQHICRDLIFKSKDSIVNETVRVDAGTCPDLKIYYRKELIDKQICKTIDNIQYSVTKRETYSSTSDLVSTQERAEMVKPEKNTESETQTISEDIKPEVEL